MRPILAPAERRALGDEFADELLRPLPLLRVLAVEHDLDDVMHLAETDGEGAHVVEAGLLAALLGEVELLERVVAVDLADGGEGDVGAVGEPVDPSQLFVHGYSLEDFVTVVQDGGLLRVFWEEEFGPFDGREGVLNQLPLRVADDFRALGVV